jgi:hypothetical protein
MSDRFDEMAKERVERYRHWATYTLEFELAALLRKTAAEVRKVAQEEMRERAVRAILRDVEEVGSIGRMTKGCCAAVVRTLYVDGETPEEREAVDDRG